MANITINQIQEYADTLKNWLSEDESLAKECLVIKFKEASQKRELVIDQNMANKTLYFQSRNGNVSIDFDKYGLIARIEIA